MLSSTCSTLHGLLSGWLGQWTHNQEVTGLALGQFNAVLAGFC